MPQRPRTVSLGGCVKTWSAKAPNQYNHKLNKSLNVPRAEKRRERTDKRRQGRNNRGSERALTAQCLQQAEHTPRG